MERNKVTGLAAFIFSFLIVFMGISVPEAESGELSEDVAPLEVSKAGPESQGGPVSQFLAKGLRVTAAPILLVRQDNDEIRLVTSNYAGAGAELLDASELDLPVRIGPDINVLLNAGAFAGEARYFAIIDATKKRDTLRSTPGAVTNWLTPIGNTGSYGDVNGEYISDFKSLEFNIRWLPMHKSSPLVTRGYLKNLNITQNVNPEVKLRCLPLDRLCLLLGARYFEIDENLKIGHNIGGLNPTVNRMEADNELLGMQVGAEAVLFEIGDKITLDGWVKTGYYENDIDTKGAIEQLTGYPSYYCEDDHQKGSFVCELGANLKYAVNPNLMLTVGYQYLWFEEVALAPDLVAISDPWYSTASIKTDDVYYNGVTLACTIAW